MLMTLTPALRATLTAKLAPSKVAFATPAIRAVVAFLIDPTLDWTTPRVAELAVTIDGFCICYDANGQDGIACRRADVEHAFDTLYEKDVLTSEELDVLMTAFRQTFAPGTPTLTAPRPSARPAPERNTLPWLPLHGRLPATTGDAHCTMDAKRDRSNALRRAYKAIVADVSRAVPALTLTTRFNKGGMAVWGTTYGIVSKDGVVVAEMFDSSFTGMVCIRTTNATGRSGDHHDVTTHADAVQTLHQLLD